MKKGKKQDKSKGGKRQKGRQISMKSKITAAEQSRNQHHKKQNLLKFFLRGLPTVDKIVHFTSVSSLCWLCRKAKESRAHLFEECPKAKVILKTIGRKYFVLKIPRWESANSNNFFLFF